MLAGALPCDPRGMTTRGLIAGAGVTAVEAVLALRHVAGRDFAIDLVAPTHTLEHRPTSVAVAFGLGRHLAIALPAGAAWWDGLDHDDRVVQRAEG
jgi:hypothetical protein